MPCNLLRCGNPYRRGKPKKRQDVSITNTPCIRKLWLGATRDADSDKGIQKVTSLFLQTKDLHILQTSWD